MHPCCVVFACAAHLLLIAAKTRPIRLLQKTNVVLACRTCFVVQALLQCERNVTKDLRAQLKAKDQIIQDLQSADKEA